MDVKQIVGGVVAVVAVIGLAVTGYVFSTKNNTQTSNNSRATASPTAESKTTPKPSATTQPQAKKEDFSVYQKHVSDADVLVADTVKGTGDAVEPGDKVAMLYKGWLTNGTMFDQSRADTNGQLKPFVFTIGAGEVIRGWDNGIVGMKQGGKRRLIVPPAVGYGATGQGSIPGNSVLIFDVELVAIQVQQ